MKRGVAILTMLAAIGAPLSTDDRVYLQVNPETYEQVRVLASDARWRKALKRIRRRTRAARKLRRGWA